MQFKSNFRVINAAVLYFQMSESLLTSLDSLSEMIFGNAHCIVMHSDAVLFLF